MELILTDVCVLSDGAEPCTNYGIGYLSINSYGGQTGRQAERRINDKISVGYRIIMEIMQKVIRAITKI